MEENLNKKISFKDRILIFYNKNRLKIFILIILVILSALGLLFSKIYSEKKNSLISEKFIQAGIFLSKENKKQSLKLYEDIILSKNKIYSILALNVILDEKLMSDKDKNLDYFDTVISANISEEQKELLIFKKSLYLMKNVNEEEGSKLLRQLIDNNSPLKSLAEKILDK